MRQRWCWLCVVAGCGGGGGENCEEDGVCYPYCAEGSDPDCACAEDGECNEACRSDPCLDDPDCPPRPTQATPEKIPLSLERDLDLLVLVDNSNSMGKEQSLLSQQFGILMYALDRLEGGFPNLHAGVVSSDLGAGSYSIPTCLTPGGDRGCLQFMERGACTGPAPEPFISITNEGGWLSGNIPDVATAVRDVGDKNGDGSEADIIDCNTAVGDGELDACDVAEAFSCIAELGIDGCGFEQHLEAVTRALSEPNTVEGGCNGGFLRDNALLAVLILADEDDCSAQNPMLFNPADQDIEDPLGPLKSFRCAEFGYDCAEEITRAGGLTLTGCAPIEDCGDDCWLYPTDRYTSFLEELRPSGKLLFAVIGGPWEPGDAVRTELDKVGDPAIASSCAGGQLAAPGLRLRALADSLGDDGVYAADVNAAVCSPDYSPALEVLRDRIRSRLMPGCLSSPLVAGGGDACEGEGEGGELIQSADEADCTVQAAQNLGSDEEVRTVLPRCEFASARDDLCPESGSPGDVTNAPCWFLCDTRNLPEPCQVCASPACTWTMRFCQDAACTPGAPAPDNTTALVACVTCNPFVPGCLCGDGVCQSELEESATSCEEDCGG